MHPELARRAGPQLQETTIRVLTAVSCEGGLVRVIQMGAIGA
jgi:hypothetical protein